MKCLVVRRTFRGSQSFPFPPLLLFQCLGSEPRHKSRETDAIRSRSPTAFHSMVITGKTQNHTPGNMTAKMDRNQQNQDNNESKHRQQTLWNCCYRIIFHLQCLPILENAFTPFEDQHGSICAKGPARMNACTLTRGGTSTLKNNCHTTLGNGCTVGALTTTLASRGSSISTMHLEAVVDTFRNIPGQASACGRSFLLTGTGDGCSLVGRSRDRFIETLINCFVGSKFDLCSPCKDFVRRDCSERSFHVHGNERQSVHIAGIDPTEPDMIVSKLCCLPRLLETYPSRGTPLKSEP